MEPQLQQIFDLLPDYQVGIIGSATRDFSVAKDIDILFLSTDDFIEACGNFNFKWNGWDAHNGHLRRGNGSLTGIDKPVQFLLIGSVTEFEDHPHAVLLRDGSLTKLVWYVKPAGWKYDKVITVDRRKQMTSKSIAMDVDGTLRSWDTGKPIEGAKDAINLLREQGWKIILHSCNNRKFIEQWANDYDIRFDSIWDQLGKPVCTYYVDDRAVKFIGWADTLKEIT